MTEEAPEKSFLDLLWERENELEKGSSGRNRVEFLKAKNDIQAALEEGWSGRMIWEQLRAEGRIRFGHTAFAKYVRTLIQGKPALGTPRKPISKAAPASPPAEAPIAEPPPTKPKRFFHNPSPKMEDYL